MYIFDHYVCFNSNVFGFVKKKVIPLSVRDTWPCLRVLMIAGFSGSAAPRLTLPPAAHHTHMQTVEAVRKKTHFHFPNSIEVGGCGES